MFQFAKFGESFGERSGFGTAGLRAERKNDGEFIKDDSGILDEHGVREIRFGRKRNNMSAEFFEEMLVGAMLRAGDFEINGLARNEANFAIYEGGTDGARDGGEHFAMASLHDKRAKD